MTTSKMTQSLSEVTPIPATAWSSRDVKSTIGEITDDYAVRKSRFTTIGRLPGGFTVRKYKDRDGMLTVVIFEERTDDIAGYVIVERETIHAVEGYVIDTAGTHPTYRGRGLLVQLYHFLITQKKIRLWSGDAQTPAGRRLWLRLSKMPKIQIRGVGPDFVDVVKRTKGQLVGKSMRMYSSSRGYDADEIRFIAVPDGDKIIPFFDVYAKTHKYFTGSPTL